MATNDALRSKEMAEKYRAHRATGILEHTCPLCNEKSLQDFKFWKVIPNNFPYDRIAARHNMIVSLRHASEKELTDAEWAELHEIKYSALQDYELIMEATSKSKSIPAHFHLHLINLK